MKIYCSICKNMEIEIEINENYTDVDTICKSCYNINNLCIKCMINFPNTNSHFCLKCEDLYNNNYYTCNHCKKFECYRKEEEELNECIFLNISKYIEFQKIL